LISSHHAGAELRDVLDVVHTFASCLNVKAARWPRGRNLFLVHTEADGCVFAHKLWPRQRGTISGPHTLLEVKANAERHTPTTFKSALRLLEILDNVSGTIAAMAHPCDASKTFNLPCLQDILLQQCKNTAPLLQAFAVAYILSGDGQLKVFQQAVAHRSEDHKYAAGLPRALESLTTVIMSSDSDVRNFLLKPISLVKVGHTIRVLHISTALPDFCYTPNDSKPLLVTCPNSGSLGINLINVRDEIDDTEAMQDFQLHSQNGATASQMILRESLVSQTWLVTETRLLTINRKL
jgi:hypothetical protein